jgi:hypothetical protein
MAKDDNYFSRITASCRLGSHLTNGYNFPLASGSLHIPVKFASTERFGATPFGLRPHTQGSGFQPALVRRDVAKNLFSQSMDLAFRHHILTCQVWARGSKVATDGYGS